MPIRLLLERPLADRFVRLFAQKGCSFDFDLHGVAVLYCQHARSTAVSSFAHAQTVGAEIEQMCEPVAYIAAARTDSVYPTVEVQILIEFYIGATEAHALAVDAGKVALAADSRRVTAIKRVVPDIELVMNRCIHRGNKIACVVCH